MYSQHCNSSPLPFPPKSYSPFPRPHFSSLSLFSPTSPNPPLKLHTRSLVRPRPLFPHGGASPLRYRKSYPPPLSLPIRITHPYHQFQSTIKLTMLLNTALGVLSLLLLVWLRCCGLSTSLLNPLDFLALQAIRKSLDDAPGSRFFQSWDFTSDPCDFPGVFCDGDKVIALNLGDLSAGSPGLTGRIDPAIGKLSSLAEFTVVPGRIIGQIPDSVSELSNLRFFAVSRNFLSGEIPAGLGELRALRTLDLSYNQLTGSIPRPLASLPVLSNLILCHNHMTGPVPSFTSGSLARVDLMHNNLSGSLSPDTFPPTLEYLSLASNQLSGPVDRSLSRMTSLNYLDLSMNRFTGIIPNQIFRFPITNLHLQRNTFFGPVKPDDQVTISTVDLSYNRLSGEISPFFSTVQNLYLNNNRFTGKVPGGLVDRLLDASIQILYLQHNYLTGIQINPTVGIPLRSSLCLQYNCMVPPVQTSCPLKAGTQKTRPTPQCIEWRG